MYQPPSAMRTRLGGIQELIRQGTCQTPPLQGLEFMCILPGGELYFQSDLDLDTDGKEEPGIVYEPTHQPQTSIDPEGVTVSSNTTPYFVLPGGFFQQFDIRLGDVAAVLYGNRIEYAVLADTGPKQKIGEGSIALHRALGFERIRNGHIQDCGIDGEVVTLVFPGSGNGRPQTPETIREIGQARFTRLAASMHQETPRPFKVCLMPGHGGADRGACGHGLVEKELNANHAWAVAQELIDRGYQVSTAPQETRGKKTPNRARVTFANAQDAVALALHINAGGGSYALIEYAADNPQSAILAEKLRQRYASLFGDLVSATKIVVLKPGDRGYECVGGAHHTAILCEPLFLDNARHADWLQARDHRVAWARAVADAVDDLAASL